MKSVLVIDTPESCSECKLSIKGMRICLPLGEYCHKGEIHPQCPLKQLPALPNKNSKLSNELDFFIDLTNTIYGHHK